MITLADLRCDRGLLVDADLLQHAELIPVVPAFNDLSVDNPGDRDSSAAHGPAAGREAESISSVSHGG